MRVDPRVWGSIFPELRAPDVAPPRPILGFRVNRVQFDRKLWGKPSVAVRSLGFSRYEWLPGRNEARCLLPGGELGLPKHLAPGTGCHCGLYACHDMRQLPATGPSYSYLLLAGVVGSGTVRIHTFGWRAQFARIVAFSLETPELPKFSARELAAIRLASGKLSGIPLGTPMRQSQRLSRALARALEERYEVPVVPLAKLTEVMIREGDFWEGEQ